MAIDQFQRRASELDAADELARFRDQFYIPPGQIYLDGNSLGLLSRAAEMSVLRTLDEWKRLGIEGWTAGDPPWFFLAEELGKLTAPLVGAADNEVIVTNSTTVGMPFSSLKQSSLCELKMRPASFFLSDPSGLGLILKPCVLSRAVILS